MLVKGDDLVFVCVIVPATRGDDGSIEGALRRVTSAGSGTSATCGGSQAPDLVLGRQPGSRSGQ
jgi:hypothetical protein